MKTKIKNLNDLQLEIARLTDVKREQERFLENQFVLLKHRIEVPTRIFNTLSSSIPGLGLAKSLFKGTVSKNLDASSGDWLNRIARIGVPLLVNSTFLRKASWLKKGLVLFASETAAGQMTKENVSNAISKLATFIKPKKKKTKPSKGEVIEVDVFEESSEDQILGI